MRMAKPDRSVAIVDDDPAVLKGLRRLLQTRMTGVDTYESADLFLAALQRGRPDCLIVDLQMPGMTGIELAHRLVTMGIHIPTIVITAFDGPGTRERCNAAGAVAFLSKPLADDVLFAAIEQAGKACSG
jgi:FixJ family two-component response regulator